MARDPLLGLHERNAQRQNRLILALGVIAVVATVAAVFFAVRERDPLPMAAPSVVVAPTPISSDPTPSLPRDAPKAQGGASADFVITDRLLTSPKAVSELEGAAVLTTICLGQSLGVANSATRSVGLEETPEASDAVSTLGIVRPGGVFRLTPREVGTFYLGEPDSDGLLFRFEVRKCRPSKK